MSKIVKYKFNIVAVSPLYFGDSEPKEIVVSADNKPIIFGNSIGGAFREYLKKNKKSEDIILRIMGGDDSSSSEVNENTFKESSIFISDGRMVSNHKTLNKDGTKIDAEYGSGKDKHKYNFKYLPEGSEFEFYVELDSLSLLKKLKEDKKQNKTSEKESINVFEEIVEIWAKGLNTQTLLLGGQKNNGFGRFKIKNLQKAEYEINCVEDLDRYIFKGNEQEIYTDVEFKQDDIINEDILLKMEGEFLYGVYQGFMAEEITGIQKKYSEQKRREVYYLPGSSIKGIVRTEVYLLLKRIILDGKKESNSSLEELKKVENKCNELFGDTKQKGKVQFSDLEIIDGKPILIERYERNKTQNKISAQKGNPKYIKIDRLTGSAYPGALKEQREIEGKATIIMRLDGTNKDKIGAWLFCLIYVLRRIGIGLVPLGGRTCIGLGEFLADNIEIKSNITETYETKELRSDSKNRLYCYFEAFKRWCYDERI